VLNEESSAGTIGVDGSQVSMSVEWKKVVGRACGTYFGDEKRIQLSVGET